MQRVIVVWKINRKNTGPGLGTFEGVFTPNILTILGVVLYLRLGWVVGNAGFIGTLAIIIIAHVITLCTALSMSSILSNTGIGAGGAYAIVNRSLGLESGGAIGIPLFLSQAFSVAFYIIGFSELWLTIFPTHSLFTVNIITWAVLATMSFISARLAFRVQYLVLMAIFLSIVSFLAGPSFNQHTPLMWGEYSEAGFWATFAIFFPAVTGILTGASMSGELRNPKKSIIKGTLAAITVGFIVYVTLAYWFVHQAEPAMLLADTSIILKLARFKSLIILGILGATLSSALSTLVSAPRTLAALADNRVIPFSRFLAKKAGNNEPRNAIIFSSLLSLGVLLGGNLNMLAGLLTMFFLTTYGAINLAVFLEQVIGVVSFRPRLHLSLLIPIVGFIGCVSAMMLINKFFTFIAVVVIISIYVVLSRKNLISPLGDVRGGIITAVTEWAAQRAMSMTYHPRLWKPAILVPVERGEDLRRIIRFVRNMIYPSGRFYSLTIRTKQETNNEVDQFAEILTPIKKEGLFVQTLLIDNNGSKVKAEIGMVLQTLLSTFLPPNTVLFTISNDKDKQEELKELIAQVEKYPIGIMCLYIHPKYGFGQEHRINLWLRDQSPNTNLAVLTALQLKRNWQGSLYLLRAVKREAAKNKAASSLEAFVEKARLPLDTRLKVVNGDFFEIVSNEPADITIIGMPESTDQIFELIHKIPNTILFVADSGLEDAVV